MISHCFQIFVGCLIQTCLDHDHPKCTPALWDCQGHRMHRWCGITKDFLNLKSICSNKFSVESTPLRLEKIDPRIYLVDMVAFPFIEFRGFKKYTFRFNAGSILHSCIWGLPWFYIADRQLQSPVTNHRIFHLAPSLHFVTDSSGLSKQKTGYLLANILPEPLLRIPSSILFLCCVWNLATFLPFLLFSKKNSETKTRL